MVEEKETWRDKLDDWALDHVPGPLYRIPFRIKDAYYNLIYITQKIFRLNHTSDRDLWNLSNHLGDIILPKLQAFIDIKKIGYPAMYSEYDDNSGFKSREKYDSYIKSGEMIGGGPEKWEADLQEMLFAFEYIKYSDLDNKKSKAFYKRWNLEDPHEKKEENKCESFMKDGTVFYYNTALTLKYGKRAEKGFELFGKHFQSLWD